MKKKLSDLRSEVEDLQGRLSLAEDTNGTMKEKYEREKEGLNKRVKTLVYCIIII